MANNLPNGVEAVNTRALNLLHMAATTSNEAVEEILALMRTTPGMTNALLAELVNKRAADTTRAGGYAPIHYACQHGLTEAVRLLLEAGAEPNITKNNGATPLLSAIYAAGHPVFTGGKVGMDDYKACVERLFDSPRFDVELNDRSGDEKCSPAWVCVGSEYSKQDALLPLLSLVLAKGFDPNGTIHGMSALHMALRNGHSECAIELVRFGADLQTKGRVRMETEQADGTEEVWTALEACRSMYDDDFTRHLVKAAVAAAAVAGPKSRARALRAAAKGDMAGVVKMAEKAKTAADSLIKAGRWAEGAGAYEEALGYPEGALDKEKRFCALTNLCACHCQLDRGENSKAIARQLSSEYPDNPDAWIALATTFWHPSNHNPSETRIAETNEIVEKIESLVRDNPRGRPDWYSGLSKDELLSKVRQFKNYAIGYSGPAFEAAQAAIDEFNRDGGSNMKAAQYIDEAVKPENNHPRPLLIRALRGSIYYAWGKDLLESSMNGVENSGVVRLSLEEEGPLFLQAKAKFKFALTEFEFCADADDDPIASKGHKLNSALALIALGRFNEGCLCYLASLRKRMELQVRNLNPGPGAQECEEYGYNSGNGQLIFHLEIAFQLARMLTAQEAVESMKAGASEEGDSYPSHDLNVSSILKRAVSLELLEQTFVDDLMEKISHGEFETKMVSSVWAQAVKREESAEATFTRSRAEAAALVMQFALDVRRLSSDASSRVVGTFLNEAREWDPNVETPDELSKIDRRVQPKRCGFCGSGNPPKTCPCGEAFYCRKECQAKAWKEHKKACASRKRSG